MFKIQTHHLNIIMIYVDEEIWYMFSPFFKQYSPELDLFNNVMFLTPNIRASFIILHKLCVQFYITNI